jgi:hypothetical protein
MSKLKIAAIEDDAPIKMTFDLPAAIHRDLVDYGKAMAGEAGGKPVEPVRLIPEMVRRFIASDRGFTRGRKTR